MQDNNELLYEQTFNISIYSPQTLDAELESAIKKSQPKEVKKLIATQSPNRANQDGNHALHIAARVECTFFNKTAVLEVIKTLLDNKANVAKKNSHDQTPIEVALKEEENNFGEWSKVKAFITLKDYTPIEQDCFHYALCAAVSRNRVDFVKLCLDNAVSPNLPNKDGDYPLHIAVRNNLPTLISLLLNYQVDITKTNDQSISSIQLAADTAQKNGWDNVILLANHAATSITKTLASNLDDVFSKNVEAIVYAIDEAMKQNNHKIVAILFEKLQLMITNYFQRNYPNSNSNDSRIKKELEKICDSQQFLHKAIDNNQQDIIPILSKHHASFTLSSPNHNSQTPIVRAVANAPRNGWACVDILINQLIQKAKASDLLDESFIDAVLNDLFYALKEVVKIDQFGSIGILTNESAAKYFTTPYLRLTKQIKDFVFHVVSKTASIFEPSLVDEKLKEYYQKTPYLLLHSAAFNPNPAKIIAELISSGVDISKTNTQNLTPISFMANRGNWEGVVAMAKTKKDEDGKGQYGYALTTAASQGKWEVVTILLEAKADTNFFNIVDNYNTALHYAAKSEKIEMIRLLLGKGAEKTKHNSTGQLPIDIAATKVFSSLLWKNWDCVFAFIDEKNSENNPPYIFNEALAAAAYVNDLQVLKRLEKAGANLDSQNSGRENTPLHFASEQGHHDIVAYLLSKDVSLTTKNSDKPAKTAIQLAADNAEQKGWQSVLAIAKKMADNLTEDPNNIDIDGLAYAIKRAMHLGEGKIAKELVNNRVLTNQSTVLGQLLHDVAELEYRFEYATDLIPALVQQGADISCRRTNQSGKSRTPIQAFENEGPWDNVLTLARSKKDEDGKGEYGKVFVKAAQARRWDVVAALLEAGANPNAVDEWGNTALHYTAEATHVETIRLLLDKNADSTLLCHPSSLVYNGYEFNASNKTAIEIAATNINSDDGKCLLAFAEHRDYLAKGGYFDYAIAAASAHNRIDIVRTLLRIGVGPNKQSYNHKYALHSSVLAGDLDAVGLLLDYKADVTLKTTHKNNEEQKTAIDLAADNILSDEGKCLLFFIERYEHLIKLGHFDYALACAVRFGKTDIVKTLLQKGASPNKATYQGDLPLQIAARYGDLGTLNLLLEHDADVSLTTKGGSTALALAVTFRHWDCVRVLADKEKDKNSNGCKLALFYAAEEEKTDLIKELLENGTTPHFTIKSHNPLYAAVEKENAELIALFIQHNADITETGVGFRAGLPPIATAAMKVFYYDLIKNWDCVLAFADNKRDDTGEAGYDFALRLAVLDNNIPVVKALLEAGADPNQIRFTNKDPLYKAKFDSDDFKFAKHYATGNTPLHDAAEKGNAQMVNLLLSHGANKKVVNKEGKNPLDLTTDKNCITALQSIARVVAAQHASAWSNPGPTSNAFNLDNNNGL